MLDRTQIKEYVIKIHNDNPPPRVCPDIRGDLRRIKSFCKRAMSDDVLGNTVSAKWVCDNYYVIEREAKALIRLGEKELPSRSRLYAYAEKLFFFTEYVLDNDVAGCFFEVFSRNDFLSDREINNVQSVMKAVIISRITALCTEISRGTGFGLAEAEKTLAEENLAKNLITSLRKSSVLDFSSYIMGYSPLERMLRLDPSGIYPKMDKPTQLLYRKKLEKMSKKLKKSETEILSGILEKCSKCEDERRHIGFYLFDEPRGGAYIFALTAVFLLLFSGIIYLLRDRYILLTALFSAIPLFECARVIADRLCAEIKKPEIIPKMKFDAPCGVPDDCRTLTVITSLLFGNGEDDRLFERLEKFSLANRGGNLLFGALCDLKESDTEESAEDAEIIKNASERIQALNEKYGNIFYLFVRKRVYSETQRKYMGYERKRGAVIELCRFVRGGKASFSHVSGDEEALYGVKYILTLDADTNVGLGQIPILCGAMAHPLNKPILDIKNGKYYVKSGYGILQPRMSYALIPSGKTSFCVLKSGAGGTELYPGAAFDIYQSFFGSGMFCGKGIFDADVFLKVIDGAFPDEKVLSHDILEGCLLRCGLPGDVVFTDGLPQTPISYFKRDHRWARGDVQAMAFLSSPLSGVSRFKLISNILRLLAPICAVILMAISLLTRNSAALAGVLYIAAPFAWDIARMLFGRNFQQIFRKFTSHVISGIWSAFLNLLYDLMTLFHKAYVNTDAIIRSIWRMKVSHKKLLEWTTASEADSVKGGGISEYLHYMKYSLIAGIIFAFFSPGGFVRFMGVSFILCPFVSYLVSRPLHPVRGVSEKRISDIKEYCRDMWHFFEENVTAEQNFLPPDNIQFSPVYSVASRCSPTNAGLYLLSVLCARDMGFTDNTTLCRRISDTLDTIEKLEKWHGHLYNWYDNETLEILGTKYISTVDSGNFVTCLTALSQGLKEYAENDPRIALIIKRIDKIADHTDFRPLYNSARDLFYLGKNTESDTVDEGCYDLYMSESRTTGYFAVARGDIPKRHWASLGRILISRGFYIGAASWTGTAFEYFMPALLLPIYPNSFAHEALEFAGREQKRFCAQADGVKVWGTSECGFYAFDAQMNYQYKAIGAPFLSLKHEDPQEKVISPYSSFLMLRKRNDDAEKNLENLKKLGMYGKYGFYEAMDFTPSRAEGEYAAVESYMAHHVGMSIIACGNFVFDNIFRKRFMSDPRMACAAELLEERIPTDAAIFSDIGEEDIPERHAPAAFGMKSGIIRCDSPRIALLSGYRSVLRISDCGHIWFERKGERRTRCITSPPERLSDRKTHFAVAVKSGKNVYSQLCGISPSDSRVTFEYSRDSAAFNITHGTRLINISFRLSATTCVLYTDISASLGENEVPEYMLYLEPVMESFADYKAHPAFCALSCEAEYDASHNILLFRRRSRKPGDDLYLAAGLSDESIGFTFESRAEKLYEHGDTIDGILRSDRSLSCADGACITPRLFIKVKPKKKSKAHTKICFMTLCASTREKAVSAFLKARENHGTRREADLLVISGVKKAAEASADRMESGDYLLLERILRAVSFEQSYKREEAYRGLRFRKEELWKHSVSGDLAIIAVKVKSEEQLRFCGKMIMLHRLCTLKGLSYDLVFLFEDSMVYTRPIYNGLRTLTARYRSDYLVNKKGGIFFVGEKDAEEIFTSCASDIFEDDKSVFPISENPLLPPEVITCTKPCNFPDHKPIFSTFGGDFIKNGFVIDKTEKTPPLAYSHVISNRIYGTVITHNSLGYTWFSNSHEKRLTVFENSPYDSFRSETVYLEKNGLLYDLCRISSKVIYTASAAEYYGKAGDTEFCIGVTVDRKFPVKSVNVKLSVPGRVFYAASPVLGSHEGSSGGIYFHEAEEGIVFASPFSREKGFLHVSGVAKAEFPSSLFSLSQKDSSLCDLLCVGGEGKSVTFALCSFYSEKSLEYIRQRLNDVSFEEMRRLSEEAAMDIMGKLVAQMAYNEPEKMMCGFWIPYQAVFCRFFARSALYQSGGAYGFRDQLQDCRIFFDTNPVIARRHIIRCASHQFEEGDVQHWWHNVKSEKGADPGIRSRCSDDYLWLIYCTCEYAQKTGDYTLFDVKAPYLHDKPLSPKEHERYSVPEKSEVRESIYLHCKRAANLFISRGLGEHGLPFIGSCDWNDGFSAVGEKGKGESVWLAFFGRITLERFAAAVEKRGDDPSPYRTFSDLIGKNTDLNAFNGKWYLRGFYDDGSPLGDESCDECKIDLLPQAFSAICEKEISSIRKDAYRIPRERITSALNHAYEKLYDGENRILKLFAPPFDKTEKNPGYIKSYAAGLRENGGQYTHGAIWGALGFLYGGQKERAKEITSALCPAARCADQRLFEKYKAEPYVLCGDVYSNLSHEGRGGWSWYTGSASWYYELVKKTEI